MKQWIGLFIGLCLASCSSKKEEVVVTALPDIKWDMQRLDRAIALASSEAAIDSILKNQFFNFNLNKLCQQQKK